MRDINENITKSMCYDVCARICDDYSRDMYYVIDDKHGHIVVYPTTDPKVSIEVTYSAVWGDEADMGEWRIVASVGDKFAVKTRRIGAAYLNRLMFAKDRAAELEREIDILAYDAAVCRE